MFPFSHVFFFFIHTPGGYYLSRPSLVQQADAYFCRCTSFYVSVTILRVDTSDAFCEVTVFRRVLSHQNFLLRSRLLVSNSSLKNLFIAGKNLKIPASEMFILYLQFQGLAKGCVFSRENNFSAVFFECFKSQK